MSLIVDYGTLKTQVMDELNRDKLVTAIPGFIRRAEGNVNRRLRLPAMEEIQTGSLSSSTLALPSRFLETIDLMINDGSGQYVPLARNDYRWVKKAQGGSGSLPKYYCERDEEIIVAPGPDSTYSYELYYYQAFANFSAESDTNWVLTNMPELYLYGAMVEANAFLKDEELMSYWLTKYEGAIDEVKTYSRDRKYPGGSLQVVCA